MRTGEEAAVLLKGGLRAVVEGFDDSVFPCAEVLSVAGFLAFLARFLPEGEVYSEGERLLLCSKDPLSFNNPDRSVTPVRVPPASTDRSCCTGRAEGGGYTYPGWWEGI